MNRCRNALVLVVAIGVTLVGGCASGSRGSEIAPGSVADDLRVGEFRRTAPWVVVESDDGSVTAVYTFWSADRPTPDIAFGR